MRDVLGDKKFKQADYIPSAFVEGEKVVKLAGDYIFAGLVVAVFRKRSGAPRYVVENEDGLLHIFNHNQLKSAETKDG